MSVPAYIWLYNSTENLMQGSSNVLLREGAIAISENSPAHACTISLASQKSWIKQRPILTVLFVRGRRSNRGLSSGIGSTMLVWRKSLCTSF